VLLKLVCSGGRERPRASLVSRARYRRAVKPWRDGVRGLVIDPDERTLLVQFDFSPYPWAPPGGGLDPGESDEVGLRRELAEELGLDEFELGPLLWRREHAFDNPLDYGGQRERCYLVRTERFQPQPRIDLAAERVSGLRWWTAADLQRSEETFGPRRLPQLVAELLEQGPPPEPLTLGK
jgi:8-oxo-dGTP diphosphatase